MTIQAGHASTTLPPTIHRVSTYDSRSSTMEWQTDTLSEQVSGKRGCGADIWAEIGFAGNRAASGGASEMGEGSTDGIADAGAPLEDDKVHVKVKKWFVPEPLETTIKSHKVQPLPTPPLTGVGAKGRDWREGGAGIFGCADGNANGEEDTERTPKAKRRLKPELIETCKRKKRVGRPGPAMLPIDKTDITPGTNHIYLDRPRRAKDAASVKPVPPLNSPRRSFNDNLPSDPYISTRHDPSKPHLNIHSGAWEPTFHPALSAIPSSAESASASLSSPPSLTGTHSLSSSADAESLARLPLLRTRDSCDDNFSPHILTLAARTAEKQLRDQALAAFPNEYSHEIVEHFYTRDSDSGGTNSPLRRQSSGDGWAAREMRLHQEKLEKLRAEAPLPDNLVELAQVEEEDSNPFWNAEKFSIFTRAAAAREEYDHAKEGELERARKRRNPPMLGKDLKFRICSSPKATKFESDQKVNLKLATSKTGGGLWGGFCVKDPEDEGVKKKERGLGLIHTPHPLEWPAESAKFDGDYYPIFSEPDTIPPLSRTTLTTKRKRSGVQMLVGLDERLHEEVQREREEEQMKREFDDTFICQVFNYLSLGYPSMAREFDGELSRISGVDVQEIRAGDDNEQARGYLGVKEIGEMVAEGDEVWSGHEEGGEKAGTGAEVEHVEEKYGPRWKALRLYIWEWARQHPDDMVPIDGVEKSLGVVNNGWGVGNRRDSWAN